MNKRGGLWQDYMGWVILGVATIILGFAVYSIVTGKAQSSLEYAKNLFLFRG